MHAVDSMDSIFNSSKEPPCRKHIHVMDFQNFTMLQLYYALSDELFGFQSGSAFQNGISEWKCIPEWNIGFRNMFLIDGIISYRSLPIDMAGFAVRVELIVAKPNVLIGVDKSRKRSKLGYLESDFLENFVSRDTVECRGNNKEVFTV